MGDLLSGKQAVVTGASSGVGRAVAAALAGQGSGLFLVGRDLGRLEPTVRSALAFGVPVRSCVADLASDTDVEDLRVRLEGEVGQLDVLVHSAGVIVPGGLADTRPEELDLQYRVNLRAPVVLTRALLPLLRAGKAQIVFVNSTAGLRANRSAGAYSATKAGLKLVADVLRQELNPMGLRVLSVYPGQVATPMQARLHQQQGLPYNPEVLLQPEDVASVVMCAILVPPRAEVTDVTIRPATKA